MIPQGVIDENTVLVLVNTIYFKVWQMKLGRDWFLGDLECTVARVLRDDEKSGEKSFSQAKHPETLRNGATSQSCQPAITCIEIKALSHGR